MPLWGVHGRVSTMTNLRPLKLISSLIQVHFGSNSNPRQDSINLAFPSFLPSFPSTYLLLPPSIQRFQAQLCRSLPPSATSPYFLAAGNFPLHFLPWSTHAVPQSPTAAAFSSQSFPGYHQITKFHNLWTEDSSYFAHVYHCSFMKTLKKEDKMNWFTIPKVRIVSALDRSVLFLILLVISHLHCRLAASLLLLFFFWQRRGHFLAASRNIKFLCIALGTLGMPPKGSHLTILQRRERDRIHFSPVRERVPSAEDLIKISWQDRSERSDRIRCETFPWFLAWYTRS